MIWLLSIPLLYVLLVFLVNRYEKPPAIEDLFFDESSHPLPDALRIVSWNVGYAGMGEESDFFLDGGSQKRPESKCDVEKNLGHITEKLRNLGADLMILQEVCRPSFTSHDIDLYRHLAMELFNYQGWYRGDLVTKLIPRPFSLNIGNATFAKAGFDSARLHLLPYERSYSLGFLKKHYRLHVSRFRVADREEEFVLMNLHLSAFDDDAETRKAQLAVVKKLMENEFEKGNFVVVGGDWNLTLVKTDFPHATDPKDLFWVHDMPENFSPPGWTWAVDPSVPSCRTAHQPYRKGENFVLVIDGFLVSPNITVSVVKTHDMNFRYTDHHPVMLDLHLGS